ncbi:hypothetical protein FJZ18_02145 [Candidatus Pacearchaeota archaeon]|nr:hypothetical protein [Candidatus Pacearchaeota archaeon]
MNRFFKSGLITALGLTGIYLIHENIDNLPAKIILEAPLVLTSLSLAYKALVKKQDDENSVKQHQYRNFLLGNSGNGLYKNAGRIYRDSKESQMPERKST